MTIKCLEFRETSDAFMLAQYRDEPGFQEHRRNAAARAMAHEVFQLATVKELPPDEDRMTQTTVYRLLVGDASVQEKFNAAVQAKAQELAQAKMERMLRLATGSIGRWGSHYGRQSIEKEQAYRFIYDAMQAALKQEPSA